jgi:hypothetical protein
MFSALGGPAVWTCPNCKIEVEPEFDLCWSCGASREGELSPTFDPEFDGMIPAEKYEEVKEAKRRSELVTLATFWSAPEAHLACSRLEAEGIAAVVTDEIATTATWGLGNICGGVRVDVPAADLTKAREIMDVCKHVLEPDEQTIAQAVKEGIQTQPSPPDDFPTEYGRAPSGRTAEEFILASYRTAILSVSMMFPLFLILPINLYSMYLLIRALGGHGDVSPAAQRRFLIALVVDLAFLFLWWIPLGGLLTYFIVHHSV